MPDLLLELFSEEIPARMQAQAARDLERLARDKLAAADLAFSDIRSFAGPRRLTLAIDGLPAAQADRREERKGPRANAPEQALAGFLRSTGLTRDQLTERDGVLYAALERAGRATPEIVAEMVEAIVRGFPWPKSMRWGAGTLRWVRPLQRILCTFDGAIVPFEIDGIASDNLTEGHRFMGDDHAPFAVSGFEAYAERLADRYVMLDPAERRARIAAGARAVCEAEGLDWIEDAGLLDEVAGLVEWPVPILGRMDAAFLDLPPEVIRTSMRVHQRYFAVREPSTGQLAPRFVVVANIEPKDGGAVIAHGNARVLTARLADARFFWTQDQQPSPDGTANFDRWLKRLEGVTFHAKLGTMAERVERIAALAGEIAPLVGAEPELAALAARLAKADLASGMVGEFPELQGVMGGYYVRAAAPPRDAGRLSREDAIALVAVQDGSEDPLSTVEQIVEPETPSVGFAASSPRGGASRTSAAFDPPPLGEGDREAVEGASAALSALTPAEREAVADAVRDHYKPQGPSDSVPTAPLTVAVALADKLDTLVGFFAIDERPTGSKDPFALRRAALGVVRLIVGSGSRISLRSMVGTSLLPHLIRFTKIVPDLKISVALKNLTSKVTDLDKTLDFLDKMELLLERARSRDAEVIYWTIIEKFEPTQQLLTFFADRLKVLLRDEGKPHDLVDAVFAPINGKADDDLVRIVRRVDALSAFLATDDGASLLAGYKRAANILKAEAKKAPGENYALNWDLALLAEPQEQALSAALRTVQGEVGCDLDREDFEAAMRHLSHLRAPVDAVLDHVTINAPDPALRLNRLRLLAGVRDAANLVADFLVGGERVDHLPCAKRGGVPAKRGRGRPAQPGERRRRTCLPRVPRGPSTIFDGPPPRSLHCREDEDRRETVLKSATLWRFGRTWLTASTKHPRPPIPPRAGSMPSAAGRPTATRR